MVAGDNAYYLEGSVETPLSRHKMPTYESSCTSAMANYFIRKKIYGTNHPHQMEHEDQLVMMMSHAYTTLSLVEGESFRRMVTNLDPSIRPITRSKFTRTLITQKFNKAETDVS